ncbi:hypothetical protein BS47DRAFT_1346061 [Hydnum rufescens UP504]|uniref:Endoplasmic reticulum junction formation protein lunapark n=1 Tax=Hydnum rufescens UP504 TaxID=1448309 RepID=A0A9P6AW60_9AGAM|nr:hypothetical protein BS47DRAFT_1346061 [Hydnum rufescens UP504]
MGWFSWFRKAPPEDYEEILATLSLSISTRQTRLTELALRERRSALWATTYTLAGWVLYSFVWWLGLLPRIFQLRTRNNLEIEKVAHLTPVIIGPLIAVSIRRIVQAWYRRKGAAEEATLKKLLSEQRTTIEDIKKKTNYYSTRNLIERYDATLPSAPQTPLGKVPNQPDTRLRRRAMGRPSGVQNEFTPAQSQPAQDFPGPGPLPQSQFVATPPQPPRRQWFDKVADALLGADDGSASLDPSRSRYALICGRCSTHNGLVLESLWEDTQYVCPKCGYFNAAPRTLRQHQSPIEGEGRPLSPGIEHQPPLPKPNFLSVPDSPSNGTQGLSRSLSPPGNVSGRALAGSEEADQTQDSIMSVDE